MFALRFLIHRIHFACAIETKRNKTAQRMISLYFQNCHKSAILILIPNILVSSKVSSWQIAVYLVRQACPESYLWFRCRSTIEDAPLSHQILPDTGMAASGGVPCRYVPEDVHRRFDFIFYNILILSNARTLIWKVASLHWWLKWYLKRRQGLLNNIFEQGQ